MMKKVTAIGIVLILIAAIVFFGFRGKSADNDGNYKLIDVTRGDIIDKAVAVGEIEPEKEIGVKSHLAGVISRMFVEENDEVEVGDSLFEVAPQPTPDQIVNAELALQEAQVIFRNTQADYERKKELYDKKLLSQSEYDNAKKNVDVARLSVQRRKEALSLLREGKTMTSSGAIESVILAPVAGTVLARYAEEGDPVEPMTSYQPGTPIIILADMQNLVFRGTVDEIDVGKLYEGMDVFLKVGALSSDTVTGRLTRIASKARKEDQTTVFDVEIEIEQTGENVLRAGYSATAEIIINEKHDILMIPERLVTFEDDSTFVDIKDSASGEIQTIPIEVGLSDGLNIEVLAGIDSSQKVIEYPPREIE
jgi:HlyD family secretion protein